MYDETSDMNIGEAVEALKQGYKVSRRGWNGKGMYLSLQEGSVISKDKARGGATKAVADEGVENIIIHSHIDMKLVDGSVLVGWLASQIDLLAIDWFVV